MNDEAVWVLAGAAMPCGAREISSRMPDPGRGRAWLDICLLGQHLPQMYRLAEIHDLDAEDCHDLGLCAVCMGYGTTAAQVPLAAPVDQIPQPCTTCGGSGRPGVRVTVQRDANSAVAQIHPQPHDYVPWQAMGDGYCVACGTRPGEFADGYCRRD